MYPKLEAAIVEHAQSYKLPESELNWFKLVCPRASFSKHSLTGARTSTD